MMSKIKIGGDARGRAELEVSDERKQELRQLLRPDGVKFTLWAGGHLAVWLASAIAIWYSQNALLQGCLVVMLASQLHALTILQHDCGHGSAYKSATANLWVGRVLAWFIFLPFTTFTEAHKRHHKYLGDPQNDPDEWFYAKGGKLLFLRECLFVPRFIRISLFRYGTQVARTVAYELLFNGLTWATMIVAAVYFGRVSEFVLIMLLPVLLLACVINPVSRGYEHYPLTRIPAGDKRRLDLRYNSVTVTSPLLGLLWANITFHVEHHMYPRVPFFNLPKLHRLMRHKNYIREPLPLYSVLKRKPQISLDKDNIVKGESHV